MPIVWPPKRAISPSEASQSRGTASQPGIRTPWIALRPTQTSLVLAPRSLDHADFRMGGQKCLRKDVVEGEHPQEGDHDRLVDGSTHPLGASGRIHPLVGAD